MSEEQEKPEKLNSKKLLKESSRRQFLAEIGLALGSGAVVYAGSKLGLDFLADKAFEGMDEAEKQLREMVLDIKSLIGVVDTKISAETDKLERNYEAGTLDKFVELGIASPAEIKQFEEIIKNSREFEEYYTFSERAREFKDRIDRRLLTLDEKLENIQPDRLKQLNDGIRGLFGMKKGQEGVDHRRSLRERLDSLCKLYDTADNNKQAQAAVLTKLNDYINQSKALKLSNEEKQLYEFLKEQCEKGEGQKVKDFIRNYDKNDVQKEALLRLRAYVTDAEDLYTQIRENKDYILKLQGLLKEGINEVEDIRKKKLEDFTREKDQINSKITELKDAVDSTIKELKQKGYDIETREDFINDTYLNRTLRDAALEKTKPYTTIAAIALGLITAGTLFYERLKSIKLRTARRALDTAVNKYNEQIDKGEENAS